MTTLYSLRTEIDRDGRDNYRITKFIDGEVESSYLTSRDACECPAGHRPSCRHRQMLPMMLAEGIANTHWFWHFDNHRVVDFSGELKSNLDALNELAARKDDEDVDWDTMAEERMGQRPLPEGPLTTEPETHVVIPTPAKPNGWRRL